MRKIALIVATAFAVSAALFTTAPADASGIRISRVNVTEHGVLLNDLPDCETGERPCLHNVNATSGYYLGTHSDRLHFVWTVNPVAGNRPARHWPGDYDAAFLDAIAAAHTSNRNWDRCWFNLESRQPAFLHCPDGTERAL